MLHGILNGLQQRNANGMKVKFELIILGLPTVKIKYNTNWSMYFFLIHINKNTIKLRKVVGL